MKQTQSIFNRPDRIRTIAYWTFTLETGALSWIVLGVILGLMLILSLFLLPKGTPR
jgi:hypothetical protein